MESLNKEIFNILSKYEKAHILGVRIEQLSRGATPCVNIDDIQDVNVRKIALKEFEERAIPLKIVRKLLDGKYEHTSIKDLNID